MDFAENYSCKGVDQVQAAYWNQIGVTLHPIVVYFKGDEGNTEHKSFVVVSDEISHSSSTVHAIIDKLIPELRALLPQVECIHYWTDGPTSQYRNKQSFFTIANHKELYGSDARWNFFEVGHGKGPCDGLGGTTKRMADEAVRCQKTSIHDAHDFYRWGISSNMKGIKFLFVKAEDCSAMDEKLKSRNVKPVKGTFKLHAVASAGNGAVFIKDTSCYCNTCLGGNVCEGWRLETLHKINQKRTRQEFADPHVENIDNGENDQDEHNILPSDTTFTEGLFVAAKYSNKYYIGKILDIDESDDTVEITFMEAKKEKFQWPKREDIIWIPSTDVVFSVKEPVVVGRTGRMYQLDPFDKDRLDSMK